MMCRVLIGLLLLLLFSCGGELTGGTSSSENAKIMGQTLRQDGDGGAKTILEFVKIEVRTDSAVPGDNGVVYETFSDDFGKFELTLPRDGSYTLYAYQDELATVRAKISFESDTVVYNPILDSLSSMKLYMPHDSLKGDETLYFQGTDIVRKANLLGDDNGFQVVLIDDIPQGLFSAVGIFNSGSDLISGELEFSPTSDTGAMVIGINESKPLWRFSLAVGVKQEVLEHYGGESDMLDSLREKYSAVSRMLDLPAFEGRYLFSVDSLFSFTGPYKDIATGADPGYDYNIYYTDENVRGINRIDYLYFGSPSLSFFKEWDVNLATQIVAKARGALDRNLLAIPALNTPFVNEGYTPEASLMYDEMASQELKAYDIACMNYNGDRIGGEPKINSTAIPNSLILMVTKNDMVLDGATVSIYRSELGSGTVEETAYLSGKTDNTGRFGFNGDIYRDNVKNVKYGNLLVDIKHDTLEKQLWLPLDEMGEVWFSSKDINFKKIDIAK